MNTQSTPSFEKLVSAAFHRCRTRALRGAEVRLDHIAEAEREVIKLALTLADQTANERAGNNLELPKLTGFQIIAYNGKDQEWRSPIYGIEVLPATLQPTQPIKQEKQL